MHDCGERAEQAGLVYIQEFVSGLTRKKCGKGFKYIAVDGKMLSCKITRDRIVSLVIPPAWRDVWICADADGHIQATGFDEAGRKQYIYHPRWHEASSAHKYGRLSEFASLLPRIRRRVQTDLKGSELSKTRVVAAVVRLLDKACIRIGNRQYLEANDSRGATTLTSEHVCRHSHEITLKFRGKSGKDIELKCYDEGLASVVEDCEKSDGEFLFSYENENGDPIAVTSSDVNSYLFETAQSNPVTAKDFRTWRASVIALKTLEDMDDDLSMTARKRLIGTAVKAASTALVNTPAVCRRSYIHSAILSHAEQGTLGLIMRKLQSEKRQLKGLTRHESQLVSFLTQADTTTVTAISAPKPSRKKAA